MSLIVTIFISGLVYTIKDKRQSKLMNQQNVIQKAAPGTKKRMCMPHELSSKFSSKGDLTKYMEENVSSFMEFFIIFLVATVCSTVHDDQQRFSEGSLCRHKKVI